MLMQQPAMQSDLSALDTDLITTHVLSELEPGELLKYLLASKETYSKRDQYARANRYTQGYEGDYFADLMNSHITGYKDGSFQTTIPKRLNPVFIVNTYNLIAHTHRIGYPFVFSGYFQDLIKAEYGYERSEVCEQIFAKICKRKWWNSTINIYDVYKIVYHLTYRKHRLLGEALEQITFTTNYAKKKSLSDTMSIIGDIYEPHHPNARALRAIMFYVIYCFMEFLKPLMVDEKELAAFAALSSGLSATANPTTQYIALAFTFYDKHQDSLTKLAEIKDLPHYIKNKMNKKYMEVFKMFEEVLSHV